MPRGLSRREFLRALGAPAALAGATAGLGLFARRRGQAAGAAAGPDPSPGAGQPAAAPGERFDFSVAGTAGLLAVVRGGGDLAGERGACAAELRAQGRLGPLNERYYRALVGRALAALGGIARFVKPGERVLLKPNASWDRPPEIPANTNPWVAAEIARQCLEAGAAEVLVADHTLDNDVACLATNGIGGALEALKPRAGSRLRLVFFRADDSAHLAAGDRLAEPLLRGLPILKALREVDRVINLPVAKQHSQSKLSLGMKNWYGFLGGNRGSLHTNIHRGIAALAALVRPSLVLLDAVRVITERGPQGGGLGDVARRDTLIAGTDQVAVDAAAAELFTRARAGRQVPWQARQIEYIRLAEERELGTAGHQALCPTPLVLDQLTA